MLRPVVTRPLLLVIAACALAGCGGGGPSDEEQIRSTLAEFQRATVARDYQALCDRILAPALVQQVTSIGLPCETALKQGLGSVRDPRLTIGRVQVDGETASVEVRTSAAGEKPSKDTLKLVNVDGTWKISSLGT
jgi:Putative lumazine-binding